MTHTLTAKVGLDKYPIIIGVDISKQLDAFLKIYPEKVIAKLVKIIKKSSDRIEPDCIFFGECTGCQWLHLKYEKQLKYNSNGNQNITNSFSIKRGM